VPLPLQLGSACLQLDSATGALFLASKQLCCIEASCRIGSPQSSHMAAQSALVVQVSNVLKTWQRRKRVRSKTKAVSVEILAAAVPPRSLPICGLCWCGCGKRTRKLSDGKFNAHLDQSCSWNGAGAAAVRSAAAGRRRRQAAEVAIVARTAKQQRVAKFNEQEDKLQKQSAALANLEQQNQKLRQQTAVLQQELDNTRNTVPPEMLV
jgi:hypothetical protein